MGTNFYLHKPLQSLCEHCGRHDPEEQIHLGKSSGGWCFSLHVYPGGGDGVPSIYNWDEMKAWLEQQLSSGAVIRSEYGDDVSFEEFGKVVTERSHPKDWDSDWWAPKSFGTDLSGKPFMLPGYASEEHFHQSNHSRRGPNGLLRHRLEIGHCIGNGDGPYDYIVGEFS